MLIKWKLSAPFPAESIVSLSPFFLPQSPYVQPEIPVFHRNSRRILHTAIYVRQCRICCKIIIILLPASVKYIFGSCRCFACRIGKIPQPLRYLTEFSVQKIPAINGSHFARLCYNKKIRNSLSFQSVSDKFSYSRENLYDKL